MPLFVSTHALNVYSAMAMELDTLRWLVAVADGSTVTEVAARYHTTQPAVSRGLQRLSSEIGAPLTERIGRRLMLTFAGEIVVEAGRRALTELDAAVHAVANADQPETGLVRFGFLSRHGTWLIPQLVAAFREEYPAAQVLLRHDGAERIISALMDGELDLLITEAPSVSDLEFFPLFEDHFVVAVHDDHPLAARRSIEVIELSNEPWVLQPTGYGTRQIVQQISSEAGINPVLAFEDHDIATLRALIGAGVGIGLFADRPAGPPGVTYVPLRPQLRRTIGLLMRLSHRIPHAASAFAELVIDKAPAIAAQSSSEHAACVRR